MLVIWDFVLAALVLVFFAALVWLLLIPPHENWLPTEFREDLPTRPGGPGAPPAR